MLEDGSHDQAAGAIAPAARATAAPPWRDRSDRPLYRAEIWPNRSLGRRGKANVMGIAAIGFAMPLIGTVGTPVFWGLVPFAGVVLACLWAGFRRNDRDGRLFEVLTLWCDEIRVERFEPKGAVRRWSAFPAWVRLSLYAEGQKVENYLTLRGAGREIELGAFLSPDERASLHQELCAALLRAR